MNRIKIQVAAGIVTESLLRRAQDELRALAAKELGVNSPGAALNNNDKQPLK
jgi:hypothetical protein